MDTLLPAFIKLFLEFLLSPFRLFRRLLRIAIKKHGRYNIRPLHNKTSLRHGLQEFGIHSIITFWYNLPSGTTCMVAVYGDTGEEVCIKNIGGAP